MIKVVSMTKDRMPPRQWRQATQLVRGGMDRSAFDETSEGLFLTSGYVYGSAEEAELAFKGDKARYIYSRYGNPTLTMFQDRFAALEGASNCVSTASGMAAVFAALASQVEAGDRVVASRALFGSCHYIIAELLPKYGVKTELVDGIDLSKWRTALSVPTKCVFKPRARDHRYPSGSKSGPQVWCEANRRQCLRAANPAAPAGSGCRYRNVLGDQAHRRPGADPGGRHTDQRSGFYKRLPDAVHAPYGAIIEPFQCLGVVEGARDVGS